MALARYREFFWFPDGTLAINVPARIFPLRSNILASIFADQAGTISLPNPLSTDGGGYLDFWAEEGEYWIRIDDESFRIWVGEPGNLDVAEAVSVGISTGVISGGTMAAAGTSVNFGETVGYVVDYSTDTFRPGITRVHTVAQSVPLSGAALARTLTWWLLDSTGTFIEQATGPTPAQRRTHIVLGFSIVFGGVVAFTKAVPVSLPQPYAQFTDLADMLGPFIISGCEIAPNGVNLSFNQSGGPVFARSFGHTAVPDNPNVANIAAQTPSQFRRATSTTTVFAAPVTTIDPANYDVGGVLTPVGGGVNSSTIQRVFVFAQDNAPDQMVVQYGQRVYPSLSAAVSAVGTAPYVVNPAFVAALAGWIIVVRTATDLSNPSQAVFVQSGAKFARP